MIRHLNAEFAPATIELAMLSAHFDNNESMLTEDRIMKI